MNLISFSFAFRSIVLFLILLFQNDAIVITHNIPQSVKPGGQYDIELKIKKGSVSGFAKFNLDLPEGITIKEKENAGASFSQQGTIAKWVWTMLPSTDEMVLKFTMTFASDMSGLKNISGKFSYILNNEKAVKDMDPLAVQVGDAVAANEGEQKKAPSSVQPQNNNTVDEKPIKDTLSNAQTYQEPQAQPEITRKVDKISDLEYRIYLTIRKGKNISGFAKFSDNLPESMNARALQTDGASFSISDYRIKFVWVNVPEKEVLNISYVLTGKPTDNDFLLGEWVYLENEQSKKVTLTKWTWKDAPTQSTSEPLAGKENNQNAPEKDNQNQATNESTLVVQQNVNQDNKTTEIPGDSKTKETASVSETTGQSINANVIFRVQVGAFKAPSQSPSTFAKARSLDQTPTTEMADGFTKYIIGKYKEYRSARDKREEVRGTVPSAFVVAYNGPNRITVQEALMVSNQKWIR
ncbi:MAG: hypothetical protein N3F09_02400 [Bacteroidia bacterium]|nr:hypothetical protein [Bacteroidia bacterium]